LQGAFEVTRSVLCVQLPVEAGVPPKAERLDRALAMLCPDLSRNRLQSLIREGHVTMDGVALLDSAKKIFAGQIISVHLPPPVEPLPQGEVMALKIVYEDADLIVIDKPPGLVVHPAAGHEQGTLVNALIAHCGKSLSGIGGVKRPGIVHRLDKDTSGLLVVAKNDQAHRGLAEQFADHGKNGALERAYLALVWGVPAQKIGTVDAALARATHNREKMVVVRGESGRHAVTHYKVEALFPRGSEGRDPSFSMKGEHPAFHQEAGVALVRCTLETGRTHQIRVHMAHMHHPLLGDKVYGSGFKTKINRLPEQARTALEALNRQALHATLLGFEHPRSGEVLHFESPLPDDMTRLIEALDA
jgi:23S rRNA pseudouridine1911/1915/1917 synthase